MIEASRLLFCVISFKIRAPDCRLSQSIPFELTGWRKTSSSSGWILSIILALLGLRH